MTSTAPHSFKKCWELNTGAQCLPDGSVSFRVWAPNVKTLSVKIEEEAFPMTRSKKGYYELRLPDTPPGTDYFYVLNGERERPDPVSRWQPNGVHGPSRVVNPAEYAWQDEGWRGIPLEDYIIYELHTGTFTPEGTFEAIIPQLPYLRELGINAVALMPVAQFPGERNWGYDGCYPYAPQNTYGGPLGLKNFIDACHQEGLAVIMDVVYNHLGPEGNYLREYGPYFTDRYKTPWGPAVNYDGRHSDAVRQYVLNNVLYWITEYHVDALRLDAIQEIFDFSPKHILEEISEAVRKQSRFLNRDIWTIAESDLNDTRIIKPSYQGGYGIDAQWNDDFHHSIHTLLTDHEHLYFSDYGRLTDLAKSIEEGYVYDGKWSDFRHKTHGISSYGCHGSQFVSYIQNHDQVANASATDRLGELVSFEQEKLAATMLLFTPHIPLLFMGQEWGAKTPFYYFTSHEDEKLGEKVKEGYEYEYYFHADKGKEIDPQNEEMFLKSKLDWSESKEPKHAQLQSLYRDLIALRKSTPALANCRNDLTQVNIDKDQNYLMAMREDPSGSKVLLISNFSEGNQKLPVPLPRGKWKLVFDTHCSKYGKEESTSPSSLEEPCELELIAYQAAIYKKV